MFGEQLDMLIVQEMEKAQQQRTNQEASAQANAGSQQE